MEYNVINDFKFRRIDTSVIDEVMRIQEEAFAVIKDPQILRANSRDVLYDCLLNHYAVGVFAPAQNGQETLVAFGILYFAHDGDENLSRYLYPDAANHDIYANMKLIIVLPAYRGHGLQRAITLHMEEYAASHGIKEVFCTISPYNPHSEGNMTKAGYSKVCMVKGKYAGADRNVFHKKLS